MPTRYDSGRFSKVTPTPQGGVRVEAVIARTGILTYRQPDGTIRRELRIAEEVFSPASMETLKNAPATHLHPGGLVDPKNFRAVSVGYTAEDVRQDGDKLVASILIQDGDIVEKVLAGKLKELSAGYRCETDPTPGVWNGQEYDVVQRAIVHNHVALLPPGAGRSGPDVSLRLDSAGDCITPEGWAAKEQTSMKIEIIDGTEYEVGTPGHAKASASRDALRLDAADKLTKAEASRDAAVAERDELKVRLDGFDEKVAAAAASRIKLHDDAVKAGVDVKLDMADAEVKRAVIAKVLPGVNLEEKDDAYIDASFDIALQQVATADLGAIRTDAKDAKTGDPSKPVIGKAAAARAAMIEKNAAAHKCETR